MDVIIPVRFKRVAAVFDDEARARLYGGGGESSGTEHSASLSTNSYDLADLVNSFFEDGDHGGVLGDDEEAGELSPETNCPDSEIKDTLNRLFSWESSAAAPAGNRDKKVKRKIHALVVKSLRDIDIDTGAGAGTDFKRRLMARLRQRGLDAGLCKSKWEKNGQCPAGDYEYIDVNASGSRFFIEVSLSKEFTIARPTNCYSSLLNMFPQIFIGNKDDLKQLTRLMSNSVKKSMKKMDIHVPPWRKLSYMQAKWFGPYKRTTNEVGSAVPAMEEEEEEVAARRRKRSVGFVPVGNISFLCRDDFSARGGGGGGGGVMRIGNLAAVLNDNTISS